MVITVNSQKFACESCIKGHRSSSCHHTDRALYEVKKKGRPVSQCEKCRALRKSKKVHAKCNCNEGSPAPGPSSSAPPPVPGAKARRFVPIAPALPNGIKDAMTVAHSVPALPPDKRQMVQTLLNPCHCRSVWKCKCRSELGPPNQATDKSGLDALASAAALCCGGNAAGPSKTNKHITSRPASPGNHKRSKPKHDIEPVPPQYRPDLPPIDPTASSTPTFPIMPPMSTITSFAGAGCTCGLECICPGCVEHRGSENASARHHDCTGGACLHCVDRDSDVAISLPTSSSASTSLFDRFLARAAALPAPPSLLKGATLNPTDTSTTYGLVEIPKLECCGGRCGCPDDQCGCSKNCDGSCAEHHTTPVEQPAPPSDVQPSEIRSCCAGKAKSP